MFSNTSAEISLNAPARCITSVKNDTQNHRFLVGACSLPPSSTSLDGHGHTSSYMGGNASVNVNPLYLLRYHEEMNEMTVDAQLDFGNDGNGEIWALGSCPKDARLVVTCRGKVANIDDNVDLNFAETALWRIPDAALREDEIDLYPEDQDDYYDAEYRDRDGNDTSTKAGDVQKSLEKVCSFDLNSRVTDMQWNPASIPSHDFDDLDTSLDAGGSGSVGITTADLLTVHREQSSNSLNQVMLSSWDISTSSSAVALNQISIPIPNYRGSSRFYRPMPSPPKASWDPHNHNLCAVTVGTGIALIDFRVGNSVSGLKGCHRFGVMDVDYNPNKPQVLSSCGQDSLVKFWDLRKTSSSSSYDEDDSSLGLSWSRQSPLRTLRCGHTHMTTCIRYNSFHDQLLLSGGTDSMVNLWRVSSISSAPLIDLAGMDDGDDLDEHGNRENPNGIGVVDAMDHDKGIENHIDSASVETDGGNAPDVRVTKMEMREAVYDLAWSAADPWLYVALGYDGNVVLNHVPSKEKYKILL